MPSDEPKSATTASQDPIRLLVIRFGAAGTSALITAFSAVTAVIVTLSIHQIVDGGPVLPRLIFIPAITAMIVAPMASYYAIKLLRDLIRSEDENRRIVQELSETLNTVNQLQGLLPICAWCKNIRDEEGSWHQLETYISKHSDAEFSHGICAACKADEDQWRANRK